MYCALVLILLYSFWPTYCNAYSRQKDHYCLTKFPEGELLLKASPHLSPGANKDVLYYRLLYQSETSTRLPKSTHPSLREVNYRSPFKASIRVRKEPNSLTTDRGRRRRDDTANGRRYSQDMPEPTGEEPPILPIYIDMPS